MLDADDSIERAQGPAMMTMTSSGTALIEACHRFCELQKQFESAAATSFRKEPEAFAELCERCKDREQPLIEAIATLNATTLEAHRARAKTLRTLSVDEPECGGDAVEDLFIPALVRDLVAPRT
jgi:hypothetical protein